VWDRVNDAFAVLAELCGEDATHREEPAAQALGLLALVARPGRGAADGSDGTDGRWRIARRAAPARVISAVDTGAPHTPKSKANRKTDSADIKAPSPRPG
jgi:hypothetical protein